MDAQEPDKIKLLHEQVESLTKSGTWELDLRKNELFWSDGVFKMLGYEPKEFKVTYEKGLSVIDPQDRQRATTLLEDALEKDAEYFIEKRMLTKSGNIIHVRSKAKIFKDDTGTPIKVIGVFQDISEFVQSEEQLTEQASLNRDVLRNLPAAFFLFDKSRQLLLWNKRVENITGYNHQELASRTVDDLFEGKEIEKVKHHIEEAFKKGQTELEAWVSNKTGEKLPLYITASTIQYKGERCIFGTGTDISKRLSLLHELQLLINNTEEAFMYVDEELNVVTYNQQMKKHYELLYQNELKKGLKFTDLAAPEQKDELNKIIKEVWSGENTKTILKNDLEDQHKYYELKFKPIFSADEKVHGIFLTSLNITEAQKAKTALQESQQKLQQVLDSSLDMLCTINADANFEMVSRSSEKLIGYKPKELEGKSFMQFVVEEDRASTAAIAEEIQKGKEVRNFHNRYRHKKGHIVSVVWSAYWEKKQNLMNCVGRDATEQLKAEKQLKLSESRFRLLVQEGYDLIVIIDSKGNYKYVSPSSDNSGFEIEDYIGKNAFDLIHPDDREWVEEEFSKIQNEKKIQIRPFRFLNSKDEWRWLESSVVNLLDEPSVQGIVANSRDVTESIKIEQELKERKERLELVMKAGSDSIWDYDAVKDELYLGEGYLRKYGVKLANFDTNLALHDALVHPHDFSKFKKSIESALKNSKTNEWESQYRFLKNDGEYAYVKDRAIILRDEEGKALRMVGAITDISRDYINEQLDKLDKQLMESSISPVQTINNTLKNYLLGIEKLFSNINASILSVVDNHLTNFMSPSLPRGFIEAIEGLPIGLNQGSCGTAAHIKEKVIVTDVFNDKRWGNYTDLAKQYSVEACWSQPIFNSDGNVVATFAIYFKNSLSAQALGFSIFDRCSNLISLVLQNFNYVKKIQQSHERFAYINKATNNAIYDWDILSDNVHWGQSLKRSFGHDVKKEKCRFGDWTEWIHPEDSDEVLQNLDLFLADLDRAKWIVEYRFRDVNDQYAYVEEVGYLIRDEYGKPLRMIGALRDQTQLKKEQFKQELQQNLNNLFKTENSLSSSLNSCLKYLTELANFSLGEIWLTSQQDDVIRMVAKYARSQDATNFYEFQLPTKFKFGEGLPGHVWKERKMQNWQKIDEKIEFLRNKAAKATGLSSAIAYPLYFGKSVLGVILFAKDTKIDNQSHELNNFKVLENLLGDEIRRKQQEEELSLFFESAPELLGVANQNGYFVKVNPAFCNLLGYSHKELTSQPFVNFLHQEDMHATILKYDETKTGQKHAKNFTNRYRTKSGEYKWISWNSSDAFGADNLVFAFGRDVTETVELQQTVENATKLAKVGGWEVDLIRNEHYWSPMTKIIHEVDEDFVPNIELGLNYYHPDHKNEVTQKVNTAMEQGKGFDFEAMIITAKGNEKWIRSIGKPQLENNKCIRLFGSFQDITERKAAELRLKHISNNIPGVLFEYRLKPNGSSSLGLVSDGAKEIFGFSAEECVANPDLIWDQIEKGGELNSVLDSIEESAKKLTRWVINWKYVMPDGSIRYHEGSGNPVVKRDGTVVWDSLIVDITDKRKAEEQIKAANLALEKHARDLEISNSELEQFAYVASHDLQEPLRMVSGFLTQLDKKYGKQLDEKANQYIYYAVDGAKRMRQIILDLLDFSKVGKIEEEITTIDLNEVVEEVCLLNKKKIEELNAKIQFKDLPTIVQHPSPMIQLFQNLISNGLKYSKAGTAPTIIIRAKELKNEWKISIKDNGIGIEEEYFDKIFNIFQRLHNKSEYSGTGMGLAIVKKIIENLHGRIWLESKKGKGTTFYFTLPKT